MYVYVVVTHYVVVVVVVVVVCNQNGSMYICIKHTQGQSPFSAKKLHKVSVQEES